MTDVQLTPNFKLSEFLDEGSLPPTDPTILENLQRLAERLQVLRDIFNAPIAINSGYRTPEHNKNIGGAENSLHLLGMAADIRVIGYDPGSIQLTLVNWSGGLGSYDTFTHLDIRPAPNARW